MLRYEKIICPKCASKTAIEEAEKKIALEDSDRAKKSDKT